MTDAKPVGYLVNENTIKKIKEEARREALKEVIDLIKKEDNRLALSKKNKITVNDLILLLEEYYIKELECNE